MRDDPLIQIEGLGKVRLSQAKNKAEGLISRALDLVQGSESGGYVTWPDVQQTLFNRTLQAYVDAIVRTEEEWIEKQPRNESATASTKQPTFKSYLSKDGL